MTDQETNALVIVTPEGISFALPLAGPITRFFAWVIDLACIVALVMVISILLSFAGVLSSDLAAAASILAYFVISIGYGIVLEWRWRGQTVGKRLLKLRVVDEQGLRLAASQIVIRNLLRFVDSLPLLYLVGGLACLLSRRGQRLGDFAANTIVVRSAPEPDLELETIASDKYNSFRDYPHLEARLRQRVSPQEAALAFQALQRRERLLPLARVKLMQDFADHFRAKVPFPEAAALGLTDEQYLRNVLDSLYRNRKGSGV